MNMRKSDIKPPTRLPQQPDLPTQADITSMAAQAKRTKSRIELPLKPEGRPEPAVLVVNFDDNSCKFNWMLYDGQGEEACVVWGASDPEDKKVVQAMRDWWITARLAEDWGAPQPAKTAKQAKPTERPPGGQTLPSHEVQPPVSNPAGAQTLTDHVQPVPSNYFTPPVAFPSLHYQNLAAAYQQPYPQQPGWPPGYYPQPGAGQIPAQWPPGYPAQPQGPMSPEMWGAQSGVGSSAAPLMLGDVLVAAGIIPTPALHAALTLQNSSPVERRRIGEILVSSGALPNEILQAAVKLQEMARKGSVPNYRMPEVLKHIYATGATLEQALGEKPVVAAQPPATPVAPKPQKRARPSDERLELESHVSDEEKKKLKDVMGLVKTLDFSGDDGAKKAKRLLDLFKQAALVDKDVIETATKSSKSTGDAIKSLLIKEAIDPVTFQATMACQKLLDTKKMRPEQAIIALGYCQRSRVGLKEAIAEMNWQINTDGI